MIRDVSRYKTSPLCGSSKPEVMAFKLFPTGPKKKVIQHAKMTQKKPYPYYSYFTSILIY